MDFSCMKLYYYIPINLSPIFAYQTIEQPVTTNSYILPLPQLYFYIFT